MQSLTETVLPHSFMDELVDLLGAYPPDRNRRRAEIVALRLADLEIRACSQGAAAETVAAIQSARVLLELAELPPLPLSSAYS